MRVINTNDDPKISLKRRPPHSTIKNIFSDFFSLNFISNKPIVKFIIDRKAPSKIDLKINPDMLDKRNNIVIIIIDIMETKRQKISSCFSFFIISSFQNRFDECVHTSKYTEKCKDYG
jgi:hypothetical protein